jgi:phage terminase large subunit-like protein
MDEHTRDQLASELMLLPPLHLEAMSRRYEWIATARPDQLPPEDYLIWMLMAGRGSGKTRSGAEEIWWDAYAAPERVAILGPTNNDVRKTAFEGESGLLARIPKSLIMNYNRTSLELWTRTVCGRESYYIGYSAEEPERLRGPQHHRAWCDELGAWPKKTGSDVWDNLIMGLRLGDDPRIVVTTTPRTTQLVRTILANPKTKISRASTFANAAHLPDTILEEFRKKYEGTRLGRQELYAELLEDVVGALWVDENIRHLSTDVDLADLDLKRVVVAVDPSGSKNDSIGIVVAGELFTGDFVVLADRTCSGSPAVWGRAVVDAYEDFGADRVVAEVNYGGAMVEAVLRSVDPNVSYKEVRATRGKAVRAEPMASLYEQGRVYHMRGMTALEEQMLLMTNDGFQGEGSPDRVDALVWALTDLSGGKKSRGEKNLAIDGEQKSSSERRE